MKFNFLIFSIFLSKISVSQYIGYEKIDESKIKPWEASQLTDYQYVYHFGESEAESDFVLIVNNGKCYGQIKWGEFNDDGTAWIWKFKYLSNVKIKGNKFISDKYNGEFVLYQDGNDTRKGLKINNPWSGFIQKDNYEVGLKSYPISDYFRGKYPQASARSLTLAELRTLDKSALKIMRNEIFARYGYKFKLEGAMDKYFKSQKWYQRMHNTVDKYLTDIEINNVRLIQQIEKEVKSNNY